MPRTASKAAKRIATLLVSATLAVSGCANSVINDPEEMARRHNEVAQSQARWNRFWGNFHATSPSYGSSTAASSSSSSSGGYASYDAQRRAAAASCVNTGGTMIGNTCTGRY